MVSRLVSFYPLGLVPPHNHSNPGEIPWTRVRFGLCVIVSSVEYTVNLSFALVVENDMAICKLIIKIMGIKIFAVIYNSQPPCLFETKFKHVLKVICRLFCHFCVICLHFLPIFSRLIVADVPKLHSVRPQHKKMYVRNRKFCEISTWMRHPRFFSMLFLFSLVPHANNTVWISVKDLYTSERTVMETPVTQKSHFCEYVRNGGVFLTHQADWQLDLE